MFDNDILIDNIRMLMANNHTTQNELANVLEMSQPNVNRALNQVDGKRFTIEQIYDIATYYGVSIDWLMGNTDSSSLSDKAICDFLSRLIIRKKARIKTFEQEEEVIEGINFGGTGKAETAMVPYTTIYFPKHLCPDDFDYEEDYYMDTPQAGNGSPNYIINDFIEKFARLYNIYIRGDMDEDDFQTLLKKHIDSIES